MRLTGGVEREYNWGDMLLCPRFSTTNVSPFIYEAGGDKKVDTGKDAPIVLASAGKSTPSPEARAVSKVADAMGTCDKLSCTIEMKKETWREKNDAILAKINEDPALLKQLEQSLVDFVVEAKKYNIPGAHDVKLDDIKGAGIDGFYAVESCIPLTSKDAGGLATRWNDITEASKRARGLSAALIKIEDLIKRLH